MLSSLKSTALTIVVAIAAIGLIILGFRLWLAAHDAAIVAAGKAACAAEKSAMVDKATFDALKAVADRDRKQAAAAALAATEAQRRADAAAQSKRVDDARIAALEVEAAKDKALSTVTEEDLKWSAAHH